MDKNFIIDDNITNCKFNEVDKPLKLGVKEGICLEGELHKTLNDCLRYFTEEKALKYVKNYFKNK